VTVQNEKSRSGDSSELTLACRVMRAQSAGTVEGWRSLRNRSSRYCGERPNFRCAPFLATNRRGNAANRRGNPNLSGTVCKDCVSLAGRRSHIRISGGTEWAASSLTRPPAPGWGSLRCWERCRRRGDDAMTCAVRCRFACPRRGDDAMVTRWREPIKRPPTEAALLCFVSHEDGKPVQLTG